MSVMIVDSFSAVRAEMLRICECDDDDDYSMTMAAEVNAVNCIHDDEMELKSVRNFANESSVFVDVWKVVQLEVASTPHSRQTDRNFSRDVISMDSDIHKHDRNDGKHILFDLYFIFYK